MSNKQYDLRVVDTSAMRKEGSDYKPLKLSREDLKTCVTEGRQCTNASPPPLTVQVLDADTQLVMWCSHNGKVGAHPLGIVPVIPD